jgi:FKBP12-rapamycin complex-associated protein
MRAYPPVGRAVADAVIDELIDVPYEENETKIMKFANYLSMIFQQSDSASIELMQLAAKALGHLARAGGTLTRQLVQSEMQRSLTWLSDERSDQRRHAAVLVLRGLVESVPTMVSGHVFQFVKDVWVG